jgi:RNA polymerase sigma-70 factor, ECF subfamily
MLYSFETTQLKNVSMPEVSNEYLMGQIKDRDESALAELHRRHAPLLRSVVSRVMNNEADIDDLIQEIFVELWNRADSYSEQKGKALGWIVTLARRRAIDRLRKKQAYQRAEERLHLEPMSWIHHGPDEDAGTTDLSGIFKKLLTQLPEAQRQALHLSYYCGMSQREIAAQTGIPLGTIKTRLELALRKVRNAVVAMGDFSDWKPANARQMGRPTSMRHAFQA